jgi:Terminase large subunit, T4likevirus-type, N-terminal
MLEGIISAFSGNPKLKKPGTVIEWTKELVEEYVRCQNDPIHFITHYVRIVNVDYGMVLFQLWPFQKRMIETFVGNRFVIAKAARQVGKCLHINTPLKLRINGKITHVTFSDLLSSRNTTKPLMEMSGVQNNQISHDRQRSLENRRIETSNSAKPWVRDNDYLGKRVSSGSEYNNRASPKLSDVTNRKFVASYDLENIEVWTDTGWKHASALHETIPYEIYVVKTASGRELKCADDHILFTDGREIFAKDSLGCFLDTEDGKELVTSVEATGIWENMYDLTVDSSDHRFYSNGFLSHNTTVAAAVLLWYILFNADFSVAILAHKEKQAREILARLKNMFENLPKWLQQGVVEWNKTKIILANGSKAAAASTSATSIRGESQNIILLDEFAHVMGHVADDFFTSVYPTIASGKTTKVIITSTPKGMNLFYKLWSDAENKKNDYVPFSVHWSDVPGRDEAWKEETIRNTSDRKFAQEFECVAGETLVDVRDDDTGVTMKITIEELFKLCLQST